MVKSHAIAIGVLAAHVNWCVRRGYAREREGEKESARVVCVWQRRTWGGMKESDVIRIEYFFPKPSPSIYPPTAYSGVQGRIGHKHPTTRGYEKIKVALALAIVCIPLGMPEDWCALVQ